MNWVRFAGYAAISVNAVLVLILVPLTAWKVYPDQTPKWSSEKTVVEMLTLQGNLSRSEDRHVYYQGDMEMHNANRPAIHQGFTIQIASRGSEIIKLDIGTSPEVMTALLQGFQLDDGSISVPVSGYYVIHMDVTYFFRGHDDGSLVKVYVTCIRSGPVEVIAKMSQWCRKERYCSLTFHGNSLLSKGAKMYCEANHANEMVTAIANSHISLAFC